MVYMLCHNFVLHSLYPACWGNHIFDVYATFDVNFGLSGCDGVSSVLYYIRLVYDMH